MPNEEFIMWADSHRPEVMKMKTLLDQPLPDELWILRDHLVEVEAYNARMTSLLADGERMYTDAQYRELQALGAGGGATSERKVHVAFAVKQERKVRDVLKGLCRAMEYRLMLGMSLLKTLNVELASSNAIHRGPPRTTRALTPPSAFQR